MPSLQDVIEVAEALERPTIAVAEDRCVKVRNRNARCRRCMDACLAGAISYAGNELTVDNHLCVNCGVCVAVCPDEALLAVDPPDETLTEAASRVRGAAGGRLAFACARIASKHVGDPEKYVEVPCLGRMEESMLVAAAADGADEIILVDGTCDTCKYRAVVPAIDATVDTAAALLEAQGSPCSIHRVSAFPSDMVADSQKAQAASRRGFFSQAGSLAKSAAMSAAEVVIAQKLNQERASKETLRQRLGVTKGGSLPHIGADRNMRVLDALDAMGASVQDTLDTRLFGSLNVAADRCNGCGMCVMFCPTGAIAYSDEPSDHKERRYLEFSAADCTQCRLCEDVCLRRCLRISSEVSTQELFDFEPRLVEVSEPAKHGAAYFDRLHDRAASLRRT